MKKIKEMLEGNPQPVVSEHTLTQILHSNQETTMAIVQLGKNMETMFKTMLDTNNNMVRLKSEVKESLGSMDRKLEQVENRTKITAEISVRTDKVLGKTYNFLRYQPMTKKERKAIQNAVEKRAKEIAPYHNMTLENTIASIYRALNKQYNVTTYNDLEHKDILSALDWIEFCELGTWKGTSTLKDPLEEEYGESEQSSARDIYGNRF
jgi:plasmid maintenance system antidote protein VapI